MDKEETRRMMSLKINSIRPIGIDNSENQDWVYLDIKDDTSLLEEDIRALMGFFGYDTFQTARHDDYDIRLYNDGGE